MFRGGIEVKHWLKIGLKFLLCPYRASINQIEAQNIQNEIQIFTEYVFINQSILRTRFEEILGQVLVFESLG